MLGILIAIAFFYKNFIKFDNIIPTVNHEEIKSKPKSKTKNKKKEKKYKKRIKSVNEGETDKLLIRDRKVINDPMYPPERRVPRHIYPKEYIKSKINIPTRGYPDNYQLMGIITRKKDEKIMQLFGRQIYPGSNQYEYYVKGKDLSGMEAKFPISVQNDKELFNNDKVTVSQMDKKKGDFVVTLYELDAPKYNPYVL